MPLLCKLVGILVANDIIVSDFRWSRIRKSYDSVLLACYAIFHFLDKNWVDIMSINALIVHTLEAIFAVNLILDLFDLIYQGWIMSLVRVKLMVLTSKSCCSIRGLDGSVTGNKFIDDPVICLSFIEIIVFLTRKMLVEE